MQSANRKVRDIMRDRVKTVAPDLTVQELERRFLSDGVSGYPVVEGDHLVGIVSRSDIVRALCVEQSLSETVAYLEKIHTDIEEDLQEDLDAIGDRVGYRFQRKQVADVMTREVEAAKPEDSIESVIETLLRHRIHRVPVVDEENRVVGIISSLDLVRELGERMQTTVGAGSAG